MAANDAHFVFVFRKIMIDAYHAVQSRYLISTCTTGRYAIVTLIIFILAIIVHFMISEPV